MPVQTRPTDSDQLTNTFFGMPVVEFAPALSGGGFGPFQLMGNIDSTELANELERITLSNSQAGTSATILEIVSQIDPQFNVDTFTLSADIMQKILGSQAVTPVSADPVAAITDEVVTLTQDTEDFIDLANADLNSGSAVVTPGLVSDEQVGIGDGTTGNTSGDFSLDYKAQAVGDVSELTSTSGSTVTTYTVVAVGAASTGDEAELVVGTDSDSGDLQFFSGGGAVNVTGTIEATYTPTFSLGEGLPGNALTAVDDARSDDGTVFTDETADANNATIDDVTLTPAVPAVADAFYVGMQNGRFNRVRFNIESGSEGVDYTVNWEYSQGGGTWAALTNVTDPTNGFLNSGAAMDVTFDVPSDWAPDTVDSIEAHYIRADVATIGTPTGATGTQVWTSSGEDYLMDLKNGRIQGHADTDKSTGFRPIILGQPLAVDYTYDRLEYNALDPFTQTEFSGKSRIRHLSSVGINIIWNVPRTQMILGEGLTWNDEDFATGSLVMKLLDDGTATPFGTLQHYDRDQANNTN